MDLTSYLVNENQGRQLHIIDGSILYRVIYRVELHGTMNWMHCITAALHTNKGLLGQFSG